MIPPGTMLHTLHTRRPSSSNWNTFFFRPIR